MALYVKYVADRDQRSPLPWLYWCRYCVALRSHKGVTHEVESFFCPATLTDVSSNEVKCSRARSRKALDCPICMSYLHFAPTGDGKAQMLACGVCKWRSDSIGLVGTPDQILEKAREHFENSEQLQKLDSLRQLYTDIDEREAKVSEKHQKNASPTRGTRSFSKYNPLARGNLLSRKACLEKLQSRMSTRYDELQGDWISEPSLVEQLQALAITAAEDVAPPDPSIFTQENILDTVPSLEQRLARPAEITTSVSDLWPTPTHLVSKRAKRCARCSHVLVRPEVLANAFKFKMQIFAVAHVPSVKLASQPTLAIGQESQVHVVITNPFEYDIEVTLNRSAEDVLAQMERLQQEAKPTEEEQKDDESGNDSPAPIRPTQTTRDLDCFLPRLPHTNADNLLPPSTVKITKQDLLPEISQASKKDEDDPQCLVSRQDNSVTVSIPVVPRAAGQQIEVGLTLSYRYQNTAAKAGEDKIHDVHVGVVLGLGMCEA